jgi:hypothetical protein
MRRTLTITNNLKQPLVVYTEPEGQDFWLNPGDTFEFAAEITSPDDDFIRDDLPNGYQIWPGPEMGLISAWDRGCELKCGHQRPAPEITWWLDWSALPDRLLWARLQVESEGSAVVFDLDGKYHRFDTREDAVTGSAKTSTRRSSICRKRAKWKRTWLRRLRRPMKNSCRLCLWKGAARPELAIS